MKHPHLTNMKKVRVIILSLSLLSSVFSALSFGQNRQPARSIKGSIKDLQALVFKDLDLSNSICFLPGGLELFLVKDSVHWKGYLFTSREQIDDFVDYSTGRVHREFNTYANVYTFDGNILYHTILTDQIWNIRQYDLDEIAELYSRALKLKRGRRMILGLSSHESYYTICLTQNNKSRNVTYPYSIMKLTELHAIPTFEVFHTFRQVIKNPSQFLY